MDYSSLYYIENTCCLFYVKYFTSVNPMLLIYPSLPPFPIW